jgi:hypothetical protein
MGPLRRMCDSAHTAGPKGPRKMGQDRQAVVNSVQVVMAPAQAGRAS